MAVMMVSIVLRLLWPILRHIHHQIRNVFAAECAIRCQAQRQLQMHLLRSVQRVAQCDRRGIVVVTFLQKEIRANRRRYRIKIRFCFHHSQLKLHVGRQIRWALHREQRH